MDSRGRLSLRFPPLHSSLFTLHFLITFSLNAPQRISLAEGKYHSRREYHVIEDNISRAIGTYLCLSLRFVPRLNLDFSFCILHFALAQGCALRPYIYFLSFSMADFSRRDTCAWLIPISAAISICVLPL